MNSPITNSCSREVFVTLLLTLRRRGVCFLLILRRNASVADKPSDLVQGTLDMLILKTLALEPMHGYGISVRLEQMSKGVFRAAQKGQPDRIGSSMPEFEDRQDPRTCSLSFQQYRCGICFRSRRTRSLRHSLRPRITGPVWACPF